VTVESPTRTIRILPSVGDDTLESLAVSAAREQYGEKPAKTKMQIAEANTVIFLPAMKILFTKNQLELWELSLHQMAVHYGSRASGQVLV
jgi:hypothetical protein